MSTPWGCGHFPLPGRTGRENRIPSVFLLFRTDNPSRYNDREKGWPGAKSWLKHGSSSHGASWPPQRTGLPFTHIRNRDPETSRGEMGPGTCLGLEWLRTRARHLTPEQTML